MADDTQPLSLLFTKTVRLRLDPVPQEQLGTPAALAAWLAGHRLTAPDVPVPAQLLREARELRESIYRAARSIAAGGRPATADREHLNAWAARHDAVRMLGHAGATWRPGPSPARSALAVLAIDAIDTLGTPGRGQVKVCSGTGCVAVYLDTSRGRTRRWCSMGTCGNRAKKNAMRERATADPAETR
ncbi:ABATE domain-containing protein [Actinoplanes sp. N902-109]|uniref:CGNR zinc finger domain-containing protein n=1 Tax=Actinoplanes sp. (strain N902-109) TaxID=649831 RepID=UPI0003293B5D|nr:ABATE domain-containing protein [Actinoplanes sp. N902-109]AGL17412.1 hypothetical protein L083_3902 [Actinoplanes sp. N902-109]